MAKAKSLTMGVDCPVKSPQEEKERIAVLRATVEKYLPAFAKSVALWPSDPRTTMGTPWCCTRTPSPQGMTTTNIPCSAWP